MLTRTTRHLMRPLLAIAFVASLALPLAAQDSPTPDSLPSFAATATALASNSGGPADFSATATALAAESAPAVQVTIAPEQIAPVATEAPAAEVTEEPTAEVTAEATEEPAAEPTAEPTVEAAPVVEPTAEPVAEPTAEPAAESEEDAGAAGTTTLVLLIGLGAVLAVGGLTLLRERFENKEDKSGA
ncbi:MAG: hypothetical protein KME04_05190 [Pleurocapsa minor GSE-CHR-MK-17-07R]|nr:hypothetical protein [Pleurocapsa minor GSE-CHR-MK 17-07R]